jgi:hypothetical protein
MKKITPIIILLLFSFKSYSQDLNNSNLIKESRKLYIDSLLSIYKGNIKDPIILYSNELPNNYTLPPSNILNLEANWYSYYSTCKQRTKINTNYKVEEISDTTIIIGFYLVREYRKHFLFLFPTKGSIIRPLNYSKNNYNDFCEKNYYMQFY